MDDLIKFKPHVHQIPQFRESGLRGEHTRDNHLSVNPRQSRLRKARANERTEREDRKHSMAVYDLEVIREKRREEQKAARKAARLVKRNRIAAQ